MSEVAAACHDQWQDRTLEPELMTQQISQGGVVAGPVSTLLSPLQNSSRAWKATIRGELSPPNPTPSSPVGGAVG